MTIQELEQQLLMLDRNERIRLIQVIAQSLALPSQAVSEASTPLDHTQNINQTSIVDFFRNSPLCEFADELDLTRDQSPIPDRVIL
ncbi:hypothetical protein ACN4EG_19155 [Alkalinema pantanalense CENA528]|uniref:hypothetical protein n=1 Tax=Alkalinema pantanalense TaxID=1620705 RepID=UPI003D6FF73E